MCGEPRVAAECTCTEREVGRCSRPTMRPDRTANDDRDHGDGSSTRPRGRRTSGSLTETRVRDWQYWSALVAADRTMNPCPLDGTDQLARHVLAACIEPDGPVDADGDQALVIVDARHPAFLPGGEAARPWDAATGALVRRPLRRRCSWPPSPAIAAPAVPGVVSMSVLITRAPTGSRLRRGGRTRAGCPYPYPVGRRTQAAPGGLFHNTLRFRGVVPEKTGRFQTGLVTRPITPIRRTGRLETNRPRGGPVAGHVSGTSPLMPASHAVGCARPRARPSAVVRRTRRRGGAGRGLTGCARPRGPAASRLTATRSPRATTICRSIRASANAI